MEESTHEDLVKQLKELQNVIDDFVEDKCDRQVVFKKLVSAIKLVQKDIASTMDVRATPCSGCRGATTTKTKEVEKSIYS